jgi:serpin B
MLMLTPLRHFFILSILPSLMIAGDFDAASASNQAGLDLFRQLATTRMRENLMISPYSITSAFTLAYVGAEGKTRSEIAQAFGFPESDSTLVSGLETLRAEINKSMVVPTPDSRPKKAADESNEGVQLYTANRLFGQQGFTFQEPFLKSMKETFDSSFETLDFRADPERSRKAINTWIENRTQAKIRDMMPAQSITVYTRLVLANALYFKAPWVDSFDSDDTQPRPFHIRGEKKTRDLPTMQSLSKRGYSRENGFTVVALDYLGSDFQCLILLPDSDKTLEAIITKLTPKQFTRWARLLDGKRTLVELRLPKFQLESEALSLRSALNTLGVKNAFDDPRGSANFEQIAPRQTNDYLALSDVLHKTFIALDEDGTEASAATVIALASFAVSSGPAPKPIQVHVDRPFLFAIQHRSSGGCLFVGQINEPIAK